MLRIKPTDAWKREHLGATIGILEVSGLRNSDESESLTTEKRIVEQRLRHEYAGCDRKSLLASPILSQYEKYYKKFEKTYHVQLQLESIALKGKSFPQVSPLVDINFLAELQTLVLTAGHDVARLSGSPIIDVSDSEDEIVQMNGTLRLMRKGDMVMRDSEGVCCSIIYGQDNRSPITRETNHALYVAYAPAGVSESAVRQQLNSIEEYLHLFSKTHSVRQNVLLQAV